MDGKQNVVGEMKKRAGGEKRNRPVKRKERNLEKGRRRREEPW